MNGVDDDILGVCSTWFNINSKISYPFANYIYVLNFKHFKWIKKAIYLIRSASVHRNISTSFFCVYVCDTTGPSQITPKIAGIQLSWIVRNILNSFRNNLWKFIQIFDKQNFFLKLLLLHDQTVRSFSMEKYSNRNFRQMIFSSNQIKASVTILISCTWI